MKIIFSVAIKIKSSCSLFFQVVKRFKNHLKHFIIVRAFHKILLTSTIFKRCINKKISKEVRVQTKTSTSKI